MCQRLTFLSGGGIMEDIYIYIYAAYMYRQNADMTSGLTCHSEPTLPFVVKP